MRGTFLSIFLFFLLAQSSLLALPKDRPSLERYLYNHPKDYKAIYRLAQVLIKEKRYDSAVIRLKTLIEKYPTREKLHFNLGLVYYKKGDLHQSRMSFRKVLKLKKTHERAKKLLPIVETKLRQKVKAWEERALKEYDANEPYRARRLSAKILAIDPLSEKALLVDAMLDDDIHRQEKALEGYERVLALNGRNGRAAARLATYVLRQGEVDRARQLVNIAQIECPHLAATNEARADLLAMDNRYVEAVAALNLALTKTPRRVELLMKRFNYLLSLKDYAGADQTLTDVQKIDAKISALTFLRGRLFYAKGEYALSLQEMNNYLALGIPANVLTVLALGSISSIYERRGEYKKSVEYVNKALRISPHDDKLLAQKSTVREKWRLATMGAKTDLGLFVFFHMKDLPKSVFNRINRLFKKAYDTVCPHYGISPHQIKVKILENTALKLPAFYDTVADEIVISREYFSSGSGHVNRGVAEHIVIHEFSHYVLRHAAGKEVYQLNNLWMIEGLAEFHSQAHIRERKTAKKIFRDGILSFPQLGNYLAVASVGAGNKRLKAYMQACLLVSLIVGRYPKDGVKRLVKIMMALSQQKPMESSLQKHLGMSSSELSSSLRAHLKRTSGS